MNLKLYPTAADALYAYISIPIYGIMNLKHIPNGSGCTLCLYLNSHLWDYEPETGKWGISVVFETISQFPFMGL